MLYRKLGKYGIKVSEVALGGWLTQGRTLDQAGTDRVVQRAFDLGVNLFDTADAYHQGEAEAALARALRGLRRDDLVLATKCFFPMSDRPNDRGLSRKHIVESVENSLRRLECSYIDLMQFHRWDPDTPLEETLRAIDDLIRQGKVLYWGVSQWQAHQIAAAVHLAEHALSSPPACNQPLYNMLSRDVEHSVMETCRTYGLGMIVFSPLAQGVITGKYLPGQAPPAGSRAADDSSNQFMKQLLEPDTLGRVQLLKEFANRQGCTLAQFALAWCLRRPEISSVIIGATSVEQVEVNVAASGLKFDAGVWEEAESILTGGAR
jgi:aryl-alcohol dehydrogenase-like predicted oxidoreductase